MAKLTLEDMVALSGVLHAIGHPPQAGADVRKRVQRIMACTSDAPDAGSQTPAQCRLPFIAVIITDPIETLFGDSSRARLIPEIAAACQLNHYLCAFYLDGRLTLPRVMSTPQVDGAIVVGQQTDRAVAQLRKRRLPLLVIGQTTYSDVTRLNSNDGNNLALALAQLQLRRTSEEYEEMTNRKSAQKGQIPK